MQITPRQRLLHYADLLQGTLSGVLETETGPLCEKAHLLIAVLEMVPLSRQLPCARGWLGRPAKDRQALASAFVAKSVYGLQTTRQLRCLCGWSSARPLPHESTFSRAFQEFAETELPQRLHEALIVYTRKGRLVGHIARDSTAIEARERFEGSSKHKIDSATETRPPAPMRARTLRPTSATSAQTQLARDARRTAASLQSGGEEEQQRPPTILARLTSCTSMWPKGTSRSRAC